MQVSFIIFHAINVENKETMYLPCLRAFACCLCLMSREMEYDGIVLESWSRWAAYGILSDPDMRNKVF